MISRLAGAEDGRAQEGEATEQREPRSNIILDVSTNSTAPEVAVSSQSSATEDTLLHPFYIEVTSSCDGTAAPTITMPAVNELESGNDEDVSTSNEVTAQPLMGEMGLLNEAEASREETGPTLAEKGQFVNDAEASKAKEAASSEYEVSTTQEIEEVRDILVTSESIPIPSFSSNVGSESGRVSRVEDSSMEPFKGFSDEEELRLNTAVVDDSRVLSEIISKLTDEQKKAVEAAVKSKNGVIKIADFPMAHLYHVNILETVGDSAPSGFGVRQGEDIFEEYKLKMFRAPLDAGWRREVVMRSTGVKPKACDVFYYTPGPENKKFCSPVQVAQYLEGLAETPFTHSNFTFAMCRVSKNPDQEIVRQAYDGKYIIRGQSKSKDLVRKAKALQSGKGEFSMSRGKSSASSYKEGKNAATQSISDNLVKTASSLKSIQRRNRKSSAGKGLLQMGMLPPKYPKGMEGSFKNLYGDLNKQGSSSSPMAVKEFAEDSLFQISALQQSGRLDVDQMKTYVEIQKQRVRIAAGLSREENTYQRMPSKRKLQDDGNISRREEITPCSSRCPDMGRYIPNLQCKSCLCLYHPECLGVPPNLSFRNFICANCDDIRNVAEREIHKSTVIEEPHDITSLNKASRPTRRNFTSPGKASPSALLLKTVVPVSSGIGRGIIPTQRKILSGTPIDSTSRMLQPYSSLLKLTQDDLRWESTSNINAFQTPARRGRPPSRDVSQLGTESLITRRPKNQTKIGIESRPVPNFTSTPVSAHSLRSSPAKQFLPGLPMTSIQLIPTAKSIVKSNAFKLPIPLSPPSLTGRTFKKVSSSVEPVLLNMKLNHSTNYKIPLYGYGQGKKRPVPFPLSSFPPSYVSMGGKMFVVLPRSDKNERPTSTAVSSGSSLSTTNKIVSPGHLGAHTGIRVKTKSEPLQIDLTDDDVTVKDKSLTKEENTEVIVDLTDDDAEGGTV